MTPADVIELPLPPLPAEDNVFCRGYRRMLDAGLMDPLEALDAINECPHGRLPGYKGTACNCWTTAPAITAVPVRAAA